MSLSPRRKQSGIVVSFLTDGAADDGMGEVDDDAGKEKGVKGKGEASDDRGWSLGVAAASIIVLVRLLLPLARRRSQQKGTSDCFFGQSIRNCMLSAWCRSGQVHGRRWSVQVDYIHDTRSESKRSTICFVNRIVLIVAIDQLQLLIEHDPPQSCPHFSQRSKPRKQLLRNSETIVSTNEDAIAIDGWKSHSSRESLSSA